MKNLKKCLLKLRKEHEGQALIFVVLLILLFAVISVVLVSTTSQRLNQEGLDRAHQQAVSAAEAGLEAFITRANLLGVWPEICQNLKPNPQCNAGFKIQVGNLNEYYTIDVEPPDYYKTNNCLNPTQSNPCSFLIKVEGFAGAGLFAKTATAEAILTATAPNFLNYAYYTNYETMDPGNSSAFSDTYYSLRYCQVHLADPNYNLMADVKSNPGNFQPVNKALSAQTIMGDNGGNLYGPDYEWQWKLPNGNYGGPCQNIALAGTDTIGGVAPYSATGFSSTIDVFSNDPIFIGCGASPTLAGPWGTGTNTSSPIFSTTPGQYYDPWGNTASGGNSIEGNFYFHDLTTGATSNYKTDAYGYPPQNPPCNENSSPGNLPSTYGQSGSYPEVFNGQVIPPANLSGLATTALQTGCYYYGPTQIILQKNNQMQVISPDSQWEYSNTPLDGPYSGTALTCGGSCLAKPPGCFVTPPPYLGIAGSEAHVIYVGNIPVNGIPQGTGSSNPEAEQKCPKIGGEAVVLNKASTNSLNGSNSDPTSTNHFPLFDPCALGDAIVQGSDSPPPSSSPYAQGNTQAETSSTIPGPALSGAFDGNWTIGADDNIIIAGNLVYNNNTGLADSTHSLGLAATNDIEVNHPLNPYNICADFTLENYENTLAATLNARAKNSWDSAGTCGSSTQVNPIDPPVPDPVTATSTACPFDQSPITGGTSSYPGDSTSASTDNTYPYNAGMQTPAGLTADCGTPWRWIWVTGALLTVQHSFQINDRVGGTFKWNGTTYCVYGFGHNNCGGTALPGDDSGNYPGLDNFGYGEIRGAIAQNYRGFFAIYHRTFNVDPQLSNSDNAPPAFPLPKWQVNLLRIQ